ncbi:MAG: hypothetical protein WC340_18655 [Kiritimatiellia bacterium]|nr:hypothetical protein [Lentisphaeria bacterium]
MNHAAIQDYLERNIGEAPEMTAVKMPQLPHFARRQFCFYNAALFGKSILFLLSQKNAFREHDLHEICSLSQLVWEQAGMLPIFVFHSISKRERLLLLKRRIQFIVPGTQMYLPQLALDLYDHIPNNIHPESSKLRPAAQAILLEQLLTGSLQGLSVSKVAQVMGFSAMGALRAANQLHELQLCSLTTAGRSKNLLFTPDMKKLWGEATPHLQNPVKKTIAVESDASLRSLPFAGTYLLSLHSSISTSRKCYALHQTAFKKLLMGGEIQPADSPGSGSADVQVWSYTLPSWQTEVDLLSLGLSFIGNSDPRISIALLELEEQRTW